ncbi:unnamed protein product [Effrenium voratum]|uniref:Uncharacterized protein n=1 Tax=Effrenium voratum TaxID=2562239 RepID=A0AA36I7R0_9DINO|nr:unnamed protein product [Effrenium voratum]CAJ1456654.1 unnamed protein product [Effrenium voratum]
MGSAESMAEAISSCAYFDTASEEVRPPWALAQADKFEYEDCPFCKMRRSHLSWLRTEIKRLTSEVAAVQTSIPPIFLPELQTHLQAGLPASGYTGGVDDIVASSCPRCPELRQQVIEVQDEARQLDAQCKARIEFRREQARKVEELLIAKRAIEAKLMSSGGRMDDGQLSLITRVNLADEDAMLTAAKQPL